MPDNVLTPNAATQSKPGEYVVVARRYRPQAFGELIGQEHVGRGLSGAILSHRVGHAYLFTGARGVGKTSTARILAKALNCERGPSPTPCNECETCLSISGGEDVDVLEIDGASNRGIDEIRQLRQNVNIRPSRSRFKVYIIDEVHMLTREAFNALLKTLEEPPEHVKFIFCTTEAEKIPITILSRCQRYDFAGIQSSSIAQRLEQIAKAEGVEAEPEALAILARRAAGSMRDSQSLLEQLLAFGSKSITVADVHAMLGTAGGERLGRLADHLVNRNAGAALQDLDAAIADGVDVGQLLDQLLGYFRDVMAVAVGCPTDNLLHTSSADQPQLKAAAQRLGLATILAVMQILDHTLSRLRYSTHGRTLAELALARIANLEDLESVSELAAELRNGATTGGPPPASGRPAIGSRESAPALAKKKDELTPQGNGVHPAAGNGHGPAIAATSDALPANGARASGIETSHPTPGPMATSGLLTLTEARELWRRAIASVDDMTADCAKDAEVVVAGPDQLVAQFSAKYNFSKSLCEKPERAAKLQEALAAVAGRPISLKFTLVADPAPAPTQRTVSPRQRRAELEREIRTRPLVERAMKLFGATEITVTEKPGV